MKIDNRIYAATIIAGAINLLFTSQAFAKVDLQNTYPSPLKNLTEVGGFASALLSNSIIFSGVMLFILILLGGIGMIANAGDAQKNQHAKAAVTSLFFGFLIIFASYWIIQIIELIFGVSILG